MVDPRFVWGGIDADSLMHSITAAYAEVVNWRRNIFAIPLGNAGKGFVNELACLFKAYAERTALEAIALTATMVIPSCSFRNPTALPKLVTTSPALDDSSYGKPVISTA